MATELPDISQFIAPGTTQQAFKAALAQLLTWTSEQRWPTDLEGLQAEVDAAFAKLAEIDASTEEAAGYAAAAETARDNAQAASRNAATWATLATWTPTVIGEGAEVLDTDTGTHTDPSTSSTVNNAGRFRAYATTVGAWTRIGDTGLSSKVSQSYVDARIQDDQLYTRISGSAKKVIYRLSAPDSSDFLIVDQDSNVYVPRLAYSPAQQAAQTAAITSAAQATNDASRRPDSALAAIAMADYRFVDVVFGCGDSHTEKDGYGLYGALCAQLVARYGMHASYFAQVGHTGNASNTVNVGGTFYGSVKAGAPTDLDPYSYPPQGPNGAGGAVTNDYGYLADGLSTGGSSTDHAVTVSNVTGVNVNSAWRCDYYTATFPTSYSGAGTITLAARKKTTYSTLATSAFSSKTGAYGDTIASVTVAADASRNEGIEFKYQLASNTAYGPLMMYGARAIDTQAETGISVHVLDARGGQSYYDFAYHAIYACTDAQLTRYYSVVRQRQVDAGLRPIVVVIMSSGHNDRNEAFQTSTPQYSLGWRASTVGDSAAAYIDNAEAWIKRTRDIWKMAGWAEDELYFLVMTSFRVPETGARDAELDAYAKIAEPHLAGQSRVSYVELQNLTTAAESASYPNDTLHYTTTAGYDFIVGRLLTLVPNF